MIRHYCNHCKKQMDTDMGKEFFEVKKMWIGNWLSLHTCEPVHLCSLDCVNKFFKDKND